MVLRIFLPSVSTWRIDFSPKTNTCPVAATCKLGVILEIQNAGSWSEAVTAPSLVSVRSLPVLMSVT
ncbi:hypothetical protein DPMN_146285 [Dreissena polymorpha]|uniref:Uncharacterized protein n=1 Tax=Dreissena polymorpha TaxID=45954 RepID=A0A9D4IYA2_DREPO|nr:hypothetical protein DPMN_146285 [Dreissena polymorpha]